MNRDGVYMLDTNIFIFMLRGLKAQDSNSAQHHAAQRVRNQIEKHLKKGGAVCVSMVTPILSEAGIMAPKG